jgi:phosphatidylglycerophosphate synthase
VTPDQAITFYCSIIILLPFAIFAIFLFPFRELSEETKKRPRSFISNALFREYWYFIMNPLKRKFIEWDISPNTITTWGFVFSVLAGVAFAFGLFGAGGWMVVLASTCDVYDGMLARARKIGLPSGAFYDSTLDRIGELAMFYGLLWFFRNDGLWFAAVFVGLGSSQIVSYVRARAEGLGFVGWKGFFQRAERMITLSLGMSLAPILGYFVGAEWQLYVIQFTVAVLALGSAQTAVARTIGIFQEIRASEK